MGAGKVQHLEEGLLREAFRNEIQAAAAVRSFNARLAKAQEVVGACRVARENLFHRASLDASVNGSDLRKADVAIADAAAEAELMTKALPYAVARARNAVQVAHAAAKRAADRLGNVSAAELDAYLEQHGRDRYVAAWVGRYEMVPA